MNWGDFDEAELLGFDAGADEEGVVAFIVDGERHDFLLAVDEDDGYRSMLEPVRRVETSELTLQFEHDPIHVKIEEDGDGAWKVIDDSGHVWMEFGTDSYDSYYPLGYVRWHPKEPG